MSAAGEFTLCGAKPRVKALKTARAFKPSGVEQTQLLLFYLLLSAWKKKT